MPSGLYHLGVVVERIEDGVVEYEAAFGETFYAPVTMPLTVVTGTVTEEIRLTVAFTHGAPPYIELIEAQTSGRNVFCTAHYGFHHVGVWTDEIDAVQQSEGAIIGPGGRSFVRFARTHSESGMLIEYVDTWGRRGFERFIETGNPRYLGVE